MRDATGFKVNGTSPNCSSAECVYGFDFSSCKILNTTESDCKYGLHNDFQVSLCQVYWSKEYKSCLNGLKLNTPVFVFLFFPLSKDHECGVGFRPPHHSRHFLCDPLLCPGLSGQCTQSVPGGCLTSCCYLHILCKPTFFIYINTVLGKNFISSF